MKTNLSITGWLALVALLFLNLQSSTALAQKSATARTNYVVLTQEQNQKLNEAMRQYRNDLNPLFIKLATAQTEAIEAVFAEKPDDGTIREKLDAVGKIQTEIALLRSKALKEVAPSVTDEQKAGIRARVGLAYNQLFTGPAPAGFSAGGGGRIIQGIQFGTNQIRANQIRSNQVRINQ